VPGARGSILALAGAVVLFGVAAAAPSVPPNTILPISVAWLLLLLGLAGWLLARARARLGRPAAAALGLAVVVVPALVVGTGWRGRLGTYLPCRRDWARLPSYLLRSSPTESIVFEVGAVRVKVCYGSPRARGRKMLGGTPVPFGRLWRTGANEPTTLRASGPIGIAGIRVDSGSAALYSVPGPETWEVVLTGSTDQWGHESQYTERVRSQELGRAVVPVRNDLPHHVETLMFDAEPRDGDAVDLVLRWERTEVRLAVRAP